jgi:hypothetical protein
MNAINIITCPNIPFKIKGRTSPYGKIMQATLDELEEYGSICDLCTQNGYCLDSTVITVYCKTNLLLTEYFK